MKFSWRSSDIKAYNKKMEAVQQKIAKESIIGPEIVPVERAEERLEDSGNQDTLPESGDGKVFSGADSVTPDTPARDRSCCGPCSPPLGRLRVEKIEGGLLVAGVAVAANCQLVLPIFGFLFLLVGCVLTAASYRGRGADEGPAHYAARVEFTGTSRALGPLLLAAGAIMAVLGAALCALARYAARAHQRLGFRCPLHGDFYPLSPQASARTIAALEKGGSRWRQWCPRSSAPQCPRSRGLRNPAPPCPAPLPFLVTSMSGLSAPGAPLSPAQTFGSIRSLSGPREVASFPLSRTPSPPPRKTSYCDVESALNSPMESAEPQSFQAVECKIITTQELNNIKNELSSGRRSFPSGEG